MCRKFTALLLASVLNTLAEPPTEMFQFHRPKAGEKAGIVADVIPFYHQGTFHAFYLLPGNGADWAHVATHDFSGIEDWGTALRSGGPEAQDASCFTGSVIEKDGRFHIFYTGHNVSYRQKRPGEPFQVIMHATSDDLRVWRKDPGFIFRADASAGYRAVGGWRDPFVFRHPTRDEYGMLITAGWGQGGDVVGYASSKDLRAWKAHPPFLNASDETHMVECPDLFRMGDWWYLIYFDRGPGSQAGNPHWKTRYRRARSPEGPWETPETNDFDGRTFGAAKSAGTETERYLFGWLARRNPAEDSAPWGWGGSLLAYQLWQRADGTLATCLPAGSLKPFTREIATEPATLEGSWGVGEGRFDSVKAGRLRLGRLPERSLVEATITLPENATAGLILGGNEALDAGFRLEFDQSGKVRFYRFPAENLAAHQILERPLPESARRTVRLRVMSDGSALAMDINGEVTLSGRMYDRRAQNIGLYTQGKAEFSKVRLTTVP